MTDKLAVDSNYFEALAYGIFENSADTDSGRAALVQAYNSYDWAEPAKAQETLEYYGQAVKFKNKDQTSFDPQFVADNAPVPFSFTRTPEGTVEETPQDVYKRWKKENLEYLNTVDGLDPQYAVAKKQWIKDISSYADAQIREGNTEGFKSNFGNVGAAAADTALREIKGITSFASPILNNTIGFDLNSHLTSYTDPSRDEDFLSQLAEGVGSVASIVASPNKAAETLVMGIPAVSAVTHRYSDTLEATGDKSTALEAASIETGAQAIQFAGAKLVFGKKALSTQIGGNAITNLAARTAEGAGTQAVSRVTSNVAENVQTQQPLGNNLSRGVARAAEIGAVLSAGVTAATSIKRPSRANNNLRSTEKDETGVPVTPTREQDIGPIQEPVGEEVPPAEVVDAPPAMVTENDSAFYATPDGKVAETGTLPHDKQVYLSEAEAQKVAQAMSVTKEHVILNKDGEPVIERVKENGQTVEEPLQYTDAPVEGTFMLGVSQEKKISSQTVKRPVMLSQRIRYVNPDTSLSAAYAGEGGIQQKVSRYSDNLIIGDVPEGMKRVGEEGIFYNTLTQEGVKREAREVTGKLEALKDPNVKIQLKSKIANELHNFYVDLLKDPLTESDPDSLQRIEKDYEEAAPFISQYGTDVGQALSLLQGKSGFDPGAVFRAKKKAYQKELTTASKELGVTPEEIENAPKNLEKEKTKFVKDKSKPWLDGPEEEQAYINQQIGNERQQKLIPEGGNPEKLDKFNDTDLTGYVTKYKNDPNEVTILLGNKENRQVGKIHIKNGELNHLAIDPKLQQKGLGTALIKEAQTHVKDKIKLQKERVQPKAAKALFNAQKEKLEKLSQAKEKADQAGIEALGEEAQRQKQIGELQQLKRDPSLSPSGVRKINEKILELRGVEEPNQGSLFGYWVQNQIGNFFNGLVSIGTTVAASPLKFSALAVKDVVTGKPFTGKSESVAYARGLFEPTAWKRGLELARIAMTTGERLQNSIEAKDLTVMGRYGKFHPEAPDFISSVKNYEAYLKNEKFTGKPAHDMFLAIQKSAGYLTKTLVRFLSATEAFGYALQHSAFSRAAAAHYYNRAPKDFVAKRQAELESLYAEKTALDKENKATDVVDNKIDLLQEEIKENPKITPQELEKFVYNSKDNWELAQKQSSEETSRLKEAGIPVTSKQQKISAVEKYQAMLPKEVHVSAAKQAYQLLTTGPAAGYLGVVSDAIKLAVDSTGGSRSALKWLFPFSNAVANLTTEHLAYTPFGIADSFGPSNRTSFERSLIRAQAFAGTVAGVAMLSLMREDRQKNPNPYFDMIGTFSKDPGKRDAFLNNGGMLRSIKVGNTYIPFQDTPLALWAYGIGAALDHIRDGDDPDPLLSSVAWHGAMTMATNMLDPRDSMAMLRSVTDLGNAYTKLRDGDPSGEIDLIRAIMNPVKGFVPAASLMRTASRFFERPVEARHDIVSAMVQGVPLLQSAFGKPALNGLGEKMDSGKDDGAYGFHRIFTVNPASDLDFNWLVTNGYEIPTIGSMRFSKKIQEYVEKGEDDKATALDWSLKYDVMERSAPELRELLGKFRERYSTSAPSKSVQDALNKKFRAILSKNTAAIVVD